MRDLINVVVVVVVAVVVDAVVVDAVVFVVVVLKRTLTSDFPCAILVYIDVVGSEISMNHFYVRMQECKSLRELEKSVLHFHFVQLEVWEKK